MEKHICCICKEKEGTIQVKDEAPFKDKKERYICERCKKDIEKTEDPYGRILKN